MQEAPYRHPRPVVQAKTAGRRLSPSVKQNGKRPVTGKGIRTLEILIPLIMPDIEIQKLAADDVDRFAAVVQLFAETFGMENFTLPARQHLARLIESDEFIALVATEGRRIAGGLTAYVIRQYYTEKPLVYIYDLAVDPAFQRRGIATRLITALKTWCAENDIGEAFVQATADDEHAVAFYRSTGALEEEVRYFFYPLEPPT
jgi:aminoglycoside 3-N-acetyltransferase I